MDCRQQLFLIITDKLLIGIILLIAGFWLNRKLEKLKGQIALQNAMASSRAEAYGELWKLSQPLTPRGKAFPTEDECENTFLKVRTWYYANNGAMYLSLNSTNLCLQLFDALEKHDVQETKKKASELRTRLKVDLGLYTEEQAKVQLPVPTNP